jgi:hypothetical protein
MIAVVGAARHGTAKPRPERKNRACGPMSRLPQQSDMAFGDIIPKFAVRWNAGVDNYMTYVTGDLPVGKYDSHNLVNLGLGHGALDGGVGYTYFDPKASNEFSATFGVTGNFKNESTGYASGIDSHLDVGASKIVTKQLQLGLVDFYNN